MRIPQRSRHDELGHVLANDLLSRIAEDPLSRRIEVDDAPLLVHRDDGVERSAEDRPGHRVTLLGCRFSPPAHDEQSDEAAEHDH
jgi:hypothetical protein